MRTLSNPIFRRTGGNYLPLPVRSVKAEVGSANVGKGAEEQRGKGAEETNAKTFDNQHSTLTAEDASRLENCLPVVPAHGEAFKRFLEFARRLSVDSEFGAQCAMFSACEKADILIGALREFGLEGHGGKERRGDGGIILHARNKKSALIIHPGGAIRYGRKDAVGEWVESEIKAL